MFVSFEGIDGSGKSTQARLLAERLATTGQEVVLTREPGGTPLGEEVRELLLHAGDVAPWAEAALFAAARAQHVVELIGPALARGATVVCDRYVDSSVAYQGGARGLGVEAVLQLNLTAVGGLLPDVTFLLLLDPAAAVGRMGAAPDRIEREDGAFRQRADAAYRALAERFPERIVTLEAARSVAELAGEVDRALHARA